MITAIFVFLGTALAVIIYFIYSFRIFALLLLSLMILVIAVKVYKEVKRGGFKKTFGAFRNYPTDNEQVNLVKHILGKCALKPITDISEDILLSVSKSGIYIIKVLGLVGQVSGNNQDTRLFLKEKEVSQIPNFFLELDEVETEIKKHLPNSSVKKIIIKKEACMIHSTCPPGYLLFGLHNFYYQLQMLEKEIIYTEEDQQIIQNDLSNSVKLKRNA